MVARKAFANGVKDDAESNVYQILRQGLDDLSNLCDAVEDKFTEARDVFNAQNPDREKSSQAGL